MVMMAMKVIAVMTINKIIVSKSVIPNRCVKIHYGRLRESALQMYHPRKTHLSNGI